MQTSYENTESNAVRGEWVIPLEKLRVADRRAVGGKAAYLGELSRFGLSVPPGFVISVPALEHHLRRSGKYSQVEIELGRLRDDESLLEEVSLGLGSMMLDLAFDPEFEKQVLEAFHNLQSSVVAVRSSAPREDSVESSWAGQYDSVLSVSESDLFRAIRRCWASLFGVRALSYAKGQQDVERPFEMAVVVQQMIEADISGVLFSIDPVRGRKDRIVIESVSGAGEALVSGEVTPNRYVLEKVGERLVETSEASREASLSKGMLKQLSDIAAILEENLGHAVDVEWCIKGERLFLVQTRPVTASGGQNEMSAVFAMVDPSSQGQFEFSWAECHPIISAENWSGSYLRFRHLPANECTKIFSFVKHGYVTTYFYKGDLERANQEGKLLCEPANFATYLERSANVRAAFQRLYERFDEIEPANAGNDVLQDVYSEYQSLFDEIYALYKISQPEYTAYAAGRLRQLVSESASNLSEEEALMVSLTSIVDFDIVKDEEIAAYQLSLEGPPSRADLLRHGRAFPWMFFNTYDEELAFRFLREKFEALLTIPREERLGYSAAAREELNRARSEKERLFQHYQNEELRYLSEMLAELALDRYRLKGWWAGVEFLFLPLFQEISHRAGLSLEEFLGTYRSEDIKRFLLSGVTVSPEQRARRLNAYAVYLQDNQCYWFEAEEAEYLQRLLASPEQTASAGAEDAQVHGTIANPGLAKGVVRIIRVGGLHTLLEDMARFKEGEIIVTTMTQPTMATLARKAAAIVTNEGGVTSHASIIARELNIPCVVGTKNATLVFEDGDYVEVDAYTGAVRKVPRDS